MLGRIKHDWLHGSAVVLSSRAYFKSLGFILGLIASVLSLDSLSDIRTFTTRLVQHAHVLATLPLVYII